MKKNELEKIINRIKTGARYKSNILSDLVLPDLANSCSNFYIMDSLEKCLDKKHFRKYKKDIIYNFNSRGFRDIQWPNNLSTAIWCIGDSFTLGLGQPFNETWPQVLKKQSGKETINISLNGASNDWIARKAIRILSEIKPQSMVIHWSHLQRRELNISNSELDEIFTTLYNIVKDKYWPEISRLEDINILSDAIVNELITDHNLLNILSDSYLISHFYKEILISPNSNDIDFNFTVECINRVKIANTNTNIIHSFIPYASDSGKITNKILDKVKISIPYFKKLDLARDGHHYDILTTTYFVKEIMKLL